jgi:hypothetical protein
VVRAIYVDKKASRRRRTAVVFEAGFLQEVIINSGVAGEDGGGAVCGAGDVQRPFGEGADDVRGLLTSKL